MAERPLTNWNSGLFDCCDDISSCCYGYWCCPCHACTVSGKFGENKCLPVCDLFSPAFLVACGIPLCAPPVSLSMRVAIRNRYGIKGDICKDIAITCFCVWCSWCQMHRELKHRKETSTLFSMQPDPQMMHSAPQMMQPAPYMMTQSAPQMMQSHPPVAQPAPQMMQSHPPVAQPAPQMMQHDPQMMHSAPPMTQSAPEMMQSHQHVAHPAPQMMQHDPQMIHSAPQMMQPHPHVAQSAPQMMQHDPQMMQPGPGYPGSTGFVTQ